MAQYSHSDFKLKKKLEICFWVKKWTMPFNNCFYKLYMQLNYDKWSCTTKGTHVTKLTTWNVWYFARVCHWPSCKTWHVCCLPVLTDVEQTAEEDQEANPGHVLRSMWVYNVSTQHLYHDRSIWPLRYWPKYFIL